MKKILTLTNTERKLWGWRQHGIYELKESERAREWEGRERERERSGETRRQEAEEEKDIFVYVFYFCSLHLQYTDNTLCVSFDANLETDKCLWFEVESDHIYTMKICSSQQREKMAFNEGREQDTLRNWLRERRKSHHQFLLGLHKPIV